MADNAIARDKITETNKPGTTSKAVLISRFSKEVTDFSSQYGSETSISYTVSNLAGRSNIFPAYGDFTQAAVFRTYGPWWKNVTSSPRKFKRTPPNFISDDYVELSFDLDVYPCKIEVWETYNPGSVVRILACDTASGTDVDDGRVRWQVLWEGQPEKCPDKSRIFSPTLREPLFKTSLIRLELCSTLCHYYTELDCVCMYGTLNPCSDMQAILKQAPTFEVKDCSDADEIVSQTLKYINTLSVSSHQESLDENKDPGHLPRETTDVKQEQVTPTEVTNDETFFEEDPEMGNGYFDDLPDEVIQLILSYLDVPALCVASRACMLMKKHCYDTLQYTELNLQPHWPQINNHTLQCLKSRCHHLQQLNLSWCGGNRGIMQSMTFGNFMKECGSELNTLYLANCKFVDSEVLRLLSEYCPKLADLDLQSCMGLDGIGLIHLTKLKGLKRLNLYRTHVDIHSLIAIIRTSPNLECLNLGSCSRINNFDEVAIELSKHCKKLKSLDFWRSRTITDVGLRALAYNCPDLEELDLGWCPELRSGSCCYLDLVDRCHKIKKLYLTANRTVCDDDLNAIASNCPDLEQLDILGTRQVSEESVLRILQSCPRMIMFDVSFCFSIEHEVVNEWSRIFPNCSIKKSFQQ
ncbi:F-box/LRR-repeat protein 4-like isoform X1 [Mytilus galloprovincialis]|uniref:F-box and leucine-rich repeat protein 4 n=1 Tax=Mytilus galloprovincialis TaxID=29158 RepID=A0A8B6C2R0_MYTGA|nr:F-box and leucine-rich repeat protein 4 [Mytilus galloprovincialis]